MIPSDFSDGHGAAYILATISEGMLRYTNLVSSSNHGRNLIMSFQNVLNNGSALRELHGKWVLP